LFTSEIEILIIEEIEDHNLLDEEKNLAEVIRIKSAPDLDHLEMRINVGIMDRKRERKLSLWKSVDLSMFNNILELEELIMFFL